MQLTLLGVMMSEQRPLHKCLFESNGNLDPIADAIADMEHPNPPKFQIGFDADLKPPSDAESQSKEQWGRFIKSYQTQYIAHLRSGFNALLKELNTIIEEKQRRMQEGDS
jgi:hypothetical protein